MARWHGNIWSSHRARQTLHHRRGWGDPERYLPQLPAVARLTVTVPVNLKDQDAFHITIEEYLQSLITLIEELARLAINSVTLGDYQRPLQISRFVKDIHAGFQILNLKNDSLRRRSDSIKYNVKKVEDIVYDLSLRNLVPKPEAPAP
jgi:predicted translin family RNA/ssDNA-binding protein